MSDEARMDLKESAYSDPHVRGMIFEKFHAYTPIVLTVFSIGLASPSVADDVCSKLPGGKCEPTKIAAVSSSSSTGLAYTISVENTAGGADITFSVDPAQIRGGRATDVSSVSSSPRYQ